MKSNNQVIMLENRKHTIIVEELIYKGQHFKLVVRKPDNELDTKFPTVDAQLTSFKNYLIRSQRNINVLGLGVSNG